MEIRAWFKGIKVEETDDLGLLDGQRSKPTDMIEPGNLVDARLGATLLPSQFLHQRLLYVPAMLRLELYSTRREIKRIDRHLPFSVDQSDLYIALQI